MPPATLSYIAHSAPRPVREDLGVYMYCLFLIALTAAILAVLISSGVQLGSPFAIAALAGMAYFVEQQTISLNGTTQLSVAFLPLLFSAVAFGPLAAMIVASASLLA